MPDFLGIDTSNYTTSAALYISEENKIIQQKMLLPVRDGQLGLRQSDAVFHHTRQLPEIIEKLFNECVERDISAVSASVRPRNIQGSYMPCFLCGEGFCRSFSAINNIPMYSTSHQVGHILAALYSADRLELVKEKFIAFHVSGGTTDCLLCQPDKDNILNISETGTSLDLKAGQAIDRTGVMLGLKFPCGAELEKIAAKADKKIKAKAVMKGGNCCLSGLENQCRDMTGLGETPENIAKYCLDTVAETIVSMTEYAVSQHGNLPIVFAGGVMSDFIIRERILSEFPGAYFAQPQFSCDNAAGVAVYAYLKNTEKII